MAREINRLHWRQMATLGPGLHADGAGLYLRVDETLARRWVLIYSRRGRRREMGLGPLSLTTLPEARQTAREARRVLSGGRDPIEARRASRRPPEGSTFKAVAERLMTDLEKGWRSPKQRGQWEASLTTHAPVIWKADVAAVDTEMMLECLRPIWREKPETASRVRGRVERVLDAAKARGLRTGENPARWRGHLQILLTKPQRTRSHHAAMPYQDVPALMDQLAGKHSVSAMALRFLILTAARSGEVRGATWAEVDGDTWTIPGERMKAGREHRVPLPSPAVKLLDTFELRQGLIFPGLNGPLTDMALAMLLRKMGLAWTVHGFRSSFRDWAGDCTAHPRELIEEALAHQVGNAVERAYRRSDALAKRRRLMEDWATFCEGGSNVVPLRAARPETQKAPAPVRERGPDRSAARAAPGPVGER